MYQFSYAVSKLKKLEKKNILFNKKCLQLHKEHICDRKKNTDIYNKTYLAFLK